MTASTNGLPGWLTGVARRLSMNRSRKRHRKDQPLDSEPESATDHFAELEHYSDGLSHGLSVVP